MVEKPSPSFRLCSNNSPMTVRRGLASQGLGSQAHWAGALSTRKLWNQSHNLLPHLVLFQKERKVSVKSLPSSWPSSRGPRPQLPGWFV